jgi:RNA polymerase sigma-70 factor (ECF subfamily)
VAGSAAHPGAPRLASAVRGSQAVAEPFRGRARGAQPALIDGVPGAVWAQREVVRSAFAFTVEDGRIVAIDVVMEPDQLAQLAIEL